MYVPEKFKCSNCSTRFSPGVEKITVVDLSEFPGEPHIDGKRYTTSCPFCGLDVVVTVERFKKVPAHKMRDFRFNYFHYRRKGLPAEEAIRIAREENSWVVWAHS
jgi:hypothetical protein